MRFSKVATILQGASFLVATSASFTTAHVPMESKVFNCLGRKLMKADFLQGKQVAVSLIAKRKLVGRSSVYMEEEFLNDEKIDTIMYSDRETTMDYLHLLPRSCYTEEVDGYDHNAIHNLLIDNLHRVPDILLKESWTTREGSTATGIGARGP
ncbi:BgTH12-05137 [Blumeria graminis f. sp. triticale]|uniref:BgTH12-05137 n=1 Tax=Blumeria graminis f. sp. triticale TaxID=1689686 RepID=A0A9W4D1S5_BLUGR|nr:BgTH12-05137 [Blumeria graminis f. sp. triticale]